MTVQTTKAQVGAALTDATGVSPLTPMKFVKDFVADFLMTAAAALVAANIAAVPATEQGWYVAGVAVLGAAIKAGYRAVLRWATS